MWLISYLILWAFVTIEGVIIIALLRVFTGLHQRIEVQQESQDLAQLTPGDILADQDLLGLSGETIELSHLWQRGNLLLLFVSVDCAPCRTLLTWVGNAFGDGQLSDWDVCVVCGGRKAQVRQLVGQIGFPREIPVAVVEYASLRWQYHVAGTPTVAIVEDNGRVVDIVVGEAEPYLGMLIRRSAFSTFQVPV